MKHYKFNIGEVRELMNEHGHNQKELSIILNLSEATMVKKFNGKVDFKVKEVVKIANHYGVDPAIFFTQVAERQSASA